MPSNLLISEVDARDPFQNGLITGEHSAGPLLTVLLGRPFDSLVLLLDPQQEVGPLLDELEHRHPAMHVESLRLPDLPRHDYKRLTTHLQALLDEVRGRAPGQHIHVSLSSGQPERHVAWMQLARQNDWLSVVQADAPLHVSAARPRLDLIHEASPVATGMREDTPPLIEDAARELDLIGDHPAFLRVLDRAATLARHAMPLLITGEPGTGKTALARFVARLGPRMREPILTFDPRGMPDLLVATSLFGNCEGAFRGASTATQGRISAAGHGTLLVENIETLSRALQERLVAFIDTRRYSPVGSDDQVEGHARLIFTSADESHEGAPRLVPALVERLSLGRLHVPPLSERRSDVPLIALHYLRRINDSLKEPRTIARQALEALQYLNWPNNIRDLRMAVERSALFARNTELTLREIRTEGVVSGLSESGGPPLPELSEDFSLEGYLSDTRKRLILRALELAKGNQSEAARLLRITPQAVHQFLKLQTKKK